MAKRVKPGVLRVLITVEQLDGQKEHCGDLNLILKSDAATLWQKLCSHVGDWGGVSLSSGMWIGRTSDLDSLGSNTLMYTVPPL